jgi:hypothetical protein
VGTVRTGRERQRRGIATFAKRSGFLLVDREFVRQALPKLQHHFAEGNDLDPEKVEPALELIDADTWQSDPFRLASRCPYDLAFGASVYQITGGPPWPTDHGLADPRLAAEIRHRHSVRTLSRFRYRELAHSIM